MGAGVVSLFMAFALSWNVPAQANLDKIGNQDAAGGLKAALEKGGRRTARASGTRPSRAPAPAGPT